MQELMVSIQNDCGQHGRTTLLNTHLKIFDVEGELTEERHLDTPAEFEEALRVHFSIVR